MLFSVALHEGPRVATKVCAARPSGDQNAMIKASNVRTYRNPSGLNERPILLEMWVCDMSILYPETVNSISDCHSGANKSTTFQSDGMTGSSAEYIFFR